MPPFGFSRRFAALFLVIGAMASHPLPSEPANNAQRVPSDAARFLGRWSGLFTPRGASTTLPVDLQVEVAQDGAVIVRDLNPQAAGLPPAKASIDGDGLAAPLRGLFGPAGFHARLTENGAALHVLLSDQTDLRLTHDPKLAAVLDNPRTNGRGERELTYQYRVPPAADLPTAGLRSAGVNPAIITRMVNSILRQNRDPLYNRTDSVILMRHGKLVLEEYFWGCSRDLPHQISSDTKSITSILAGMAIDRGKLKTSTLVSEFFADRGQTAWMKNGYGITVRDLLSMQAGLAWDEDVPYQDSRNTTVAFSAAPDPIAFVLDRPLVDQPGTTYRYNSGLPTLMGVLLNKALEEPLDSFADREFFRPLGITNYSWSHRGGVLQTAGGMTLRPIDMAKVGQLMLNGGTWRGQRIVSTEWVKQATTQQTKASDYPYGYYFHVITAANPAFGGRKGFMAVGQGGQFIAVVPSLDLVAVVTSSNWQPGGSRIAQREIIERFLIPSVAKRLPTTGSHTRSITLIRQAHGAPCAESQFCLNSKPS